MEVHTLSLNDFNRPKVLTGNDAAYVAIIHLIYLDIDLIVKKIY